MATKLTFRARLQARVRAWLGIDALADMPSLTMFKAMELAQAKRHEELLGAVNKLTMVLQNAHAMDRPQPVPGVLSWETVEAIAMQSLQDSSQKED